MNNDVKDLMLVKKEKTIKNDLSQENSNNNISLSKDDDYTSMLFLQEIMLSFKRLVD